MKAIDPAQTLRQATGGPSSHTIWASQKEFTAWTKSEQFRAAHQHAGERKPLTLGHPKFEGFEVIQTIETTHPPA